MQALVLDFDGTMTDAEAEGGPFRAGYLEDLCALVGRKAGDPEISAIADAVDHELAAAPEKHPFTWLGQAVAPATGDPYLRMVPIANRIFDTFGVMPSAQERGRLFGTVLYKYNYAKTLGRPVFRPGAGECLQRLIDRPVFVVTNSDTHAVASKIATLDREYPGVARLTARVHGFARKFDLDPAWDGVAPELTLPGLDRPVLLRRRIYHDMLAQVVAEAQGTFAELCVVGDIFELDLALPLALGARVGLVRGARTPEYELAFVRAHPRGRVIEDLADIEAFAFG
ncbi:MAG TPA: hypothetical protein PKU97_25030 [Kofleriaceae bacterium]|nr:hypothetical protein [Kofleriaceae bacterium]